MGLYPYPRGVLTEPEGLDIYEEYALGADSRTHTLAYGKIQEDIVIRRTSLDLDRTRLALSRITFSPAERAIRQRGTNAGY